MGNFNCQEMWHNLRNHTYYKSPLDKAFKLSSPLYRILHRFIVKNIYAKGDNDGIVTKTDCFLLYCLINGMKINGGAFSRTKIQIYNLGETLHTGVL